MDMAYKQTLGSKLMAREEFVDYVQRVRCRDAHLMLPEFGQEFKPNCRDIIDGSGPVPFS
jgi:hypothetical protein